MTRLYIQPSFLNSCEEHGLWSGGNDQYRGDRSVDLATFDKNGRARVEAFSDEAIDSLKKRKTSIPITDLILPQKRRLVTLRGQMIELETIYRAGEMDISEYSLLRDIIVAKIQRQEVLYKRAASVKPKSAETDEDSAQVQAEYTPSSSFSPQPNDGYASEEYEEIGVVWIDELSSNNSFKKPLKIACTLIKTALHWSHKARSYWNELKAV